MQFKFKKNSFQFIFLLIILVAINYVFSFYFFRIDLTSEKKFTLNKHTKQILKELHNPVYINIYLDGKLPPGIKRLQQSTKETIDDFKAYAKNNIQYKFINLSKITSKAEKNRIYYELTKKGIKPININIKEKEGGFSQTLLFPGALVKFNGKEIAVNLLENNPGLSGEENLNNSLEALEFKFINAIHQVTLTNKSKIAFIEGNEELDEFEVADITSELSKNYIIDRVKINGYNGILDDYELIIIAKPLKRYNEKDKYIIDQYLMNGGKIFWLIDAVNVEHDSLSTLGITLAFMNETNLEDQLFKYGIRINPVLVQDLQSAIIPVVGQNNEFIPAPWPYFPLLNGHENHPASKNLTMIKSEYASYIDTVGDYPNNKKIVLLHSSAYSKTKNIPAQISISEVMNTTNEKEFTRMHLPVGYLLKGEFKSVFKNRDISKFTKNKNEFIDKSKSTEMIIIADGDIIKNHTQQKPNGIIIEPLGYDRYTKQTFGNKDFIMNAINYLAGEQSLIELRSKEVKLRLLDKQKINQNRVKWQIINLLLPCIIIALTGFIFNWNRKRKYGK